MKNPTPATLRSTSTPDGFHRGTGFQRMSGLDPRLDHVMDMIALFQESKAEDEYSAMADKLKKETKARRALKNHPLVVTHDFLVGDLLDQTPEVLQDVVRTCELAKTLGREETFKVLWVEDNDQTLAGLCRQIGMIRFADSSAAIQARITEIENEKKKKEVKKMSSIPTRPTAAAPARREIPAAPTKRPEGSDAMGMIQLPDGSMGYTCACACGASMKPEYARVPGFDDMRNRQDGERVGVKDLWRHAFAPSCVRGLPSFKLTDTRSKIEAYDAETARRQQAYREAEQKRKEAFATEQKRRLERKYDGGPIFGNLSSSDKKTMRQGKTARDAANRSGRRAA